MIPSKPFQSESVDQLMLALMKVHAESGVTISKDRKGNRGTYASLPSVLDSIHAVCNKHGLILTQASRITDDGKFALETTLHHPSSNQWVSSQSLLTPNPDAPSLDQSWGGSSTYHRRYDAMMLVGMFSEDDPTDHDGNHGPTTSVATRVENQSELISVKQLGLLKAKIGSNKELENKIMAKLNINDLSMTPWKKFNVILDFIDGK